MNQSMPRVSVIVPCRNEARHIRTFLDQVLGQQTGGLEWELIVADGMSDDGTREILAEYAAREPRLRVIDNPGKIVSTGLNRAIGIARGEIVIRMDVHTEYAPDYIRQCVAVLEETGADNVGGAMARQRTIVRWRGDQRRVPFGVRVRGCAWSSSLA